MLPELEAIRAARQISQEGLPKLALHQINFGMTLCHSARCLGGGAASMGVVPCP